MNAEAATATAVPAGTASSWPEADSSVDAMAHITADLDDLSNIFNIADFDLDTIQNVDPEQYGEHMQNLQASANSTTYMDGLAQPMHGSVAHDFADSNHNNATHLLTDRSQHRQPQNQKFLASDQSYQNPNWQQFPTHPTQLFSNGAHDQFVTGSHIPPTPNSYEMHGETAHFLQQQHSLFTQQKHINNIDPHALQALQQHANTAHRAAHFTPMTSPSGTPQYAMQPEYTTPGAYFSPLTSPALHAQMQPTTNHSHNFQQPASGCFTNPSTAPSSNAPSPVDLGSADVDMADSNAAADNASKKSRKKLVTPRSVASSSARVRQSPIQKPQKRKSGLVSSVVSARELDKINTDSQVSANRTLAPSSAARVSQAFDSSESGSISPEPLSEALMRPPPRPGKTAQSPAVQQHITIPSNAAVASISQKAAAATPKSILSMRGDAAARVSSSNMTSPDTSSLLATPTVSSFGQISLDDLELPEAAALKQPSRRTSTITRTAEPATRGDNVDSSMQDLAYSVDGSRKTPKLGPLSTPSSARPESIAGDSPSVIHSPAFGSTPAGLLKQQKKNDSKSSRSTKKRGSVGASGSAMASPALRPRISPSIKPLLPEGSSLHSPTHALLLASKSNYQNLLEGNLLPGVNYPDSLSTGLTSKRTSHKVAEQGRRNRINEALKEMQSLIPSPTLIAKSGLDESTSMKEEDDSPDATGLDLDGKDGKENSSKSNSSKAATVESANRYIRMLKESEMSQRAAIQALKQENEEMRRKLAEAMGHKEVNGEKLATEDMPSIQESDDSADT